MVSRRNFFVISLLFLTAFVMFMSVNVTTDILAKNTVSSTDYVKNIQIRESLLTADKLEFSLPSASQPSGITDTSMNEYVAASGKTAAILVSSLDSDCLGWFREWCTYQKFPYSVFATLPTAEELKAYDLIILGDISLDNESAKTLLSYTDDKHDLFVTQVPDFEEVRKSVRLRQLLGVSKCISDDYALKSIHILKNFFISGERIYDNESVYDGSENMEFKVPYYLLRSGYQVYVQGTPEDASVHYYDYPAVLWRACTGSSNVYVVNSELFSTRNIIGVLTAFLSQTERCTVYPVVDATTISVLNYPLLSSENDEVLRRLYSRDSQGLNRDTLWPAIDKILLSYKASYNFFMSPKLDYFSNSDPDAEVLSFYGQEIAKRMGLVGLSMDQVSHLPLSSKLRQDADFLETSPAYRNIQTSYVPRSEMRTFSQNTNGVFDDISIVVSDYDEASPLLDITDDGVVVCSFTQDGYEHTIQDDLDMICYETALGMCNQQVDIAKVFYPQNDISWRYYSTQWSKGVTYLQDFREFRNSSIFTLGENVVNFLALKYNIERSDGCFKLHVDSPSGEASFILRLSGAVITDVVNADYVQISDSAYLLRCKAADVEIYYEDLYLLKDTPDEYLEVS